jgi:hypothetical protein
VVPSQVAVNAALRETGTVTLPHAELLAPLASVTVTDTV